MHFQKTDAKANRRPRVMQMIRVYLTNGILVKPSLDPPRLWHSYLPVMSDPSIKRYADHANVNVSQKFALPKMRQPDFLQTQDSKLPQLVSSINIRKQKSLTEYQRFPAEIQRDGVWLLTKRPTTTATMRTTATTMMTTTLPAPRAIRENQRHVPRRSSYQVIEKPEVYLTDYLDNSKLPYHGKAESAYPSRRPYDITTVIKDLDRFLNGDSGSLNNDSYNSKLHPPPNPLLALILSRYGRYVPGTRNPRVYAYMAVNNIHNSRPFGSYKLECEEEPIYMTK